MTRLPKTAVASLRIVLACCISAAAVAASPPLVTTTGKLVESSGGARYEQMANKSASLLEGQDRSGLTTHLQQLKTDPGLSEPAREKLLRETVLGLAAIEPTPQLKAAVGSLSGYQIETWLLTREHGHPEPYPAYDVAAAARFVERRWQETAARKTAAAALEQGDIVAIDAYIGGSEAVRRGFEEAFSAAGPARLAAFSEVLADRLESGQPVAGLAVAAALASQDGRLWQTVVREAPPKAATRAVAEFDPAVWGGQAVALLAGATLRDETASAAMLRLAPLAGSDPAARHLLFDAIGGPHGTSAAAALARGADARIVDQLAALLDQADDPISRRRALLALRLAGDGRAEDHLAAFARRPDAPADLIAEVPSWLRD